MVRWHPAPASPLPHWQNGTAVAHPCAACHANRSAARLLQTAEFQPGDDTVEHWCLPVLGQALPLSALRVAADHDALASTQGGRVTRLLLPQRRRESVRLLPGPRSRFPRPRCRRGCGPDLDRGNLRPSQGAPPFILVCALTDPPLVIPEAARLRADSLEAPLRPPGGTALEEPRLPAL